MNFRLLQHVRILDCNAKALITNIVGDRYMLRLPDGKIRRCKESEVMRNFDIEEYCNRLPKVLTQPKFSELNSGDDDQ